MKNITGLLFAALLIAAAPLAHADFLNEARTFVVDGRNTPTENWEGPHVTEIKTEEDWKKVVAASKKEPVFVFKHSTECPISAGAAFRTNDFLKDAPKGTPKFFFVKVIETKPVSKTIEANTRVKHESPQLILLKDGKATWNTSHENITQESINVAIKGHATDDEGSDSK
jgi:bacillithiol system protein YtxJ